MHVMNQLDAYAATALSCKFLPYRCLTRLVAGYRGDPTFWLRCSFGYLQGSESPGLRETVCMTNQTTNQQQRFQHREDYKVQKLVERVEAKLALRGRANREAVQASPRN
jgi:hypothetical protein